MPITKNAYIRYHILDDCFRNTGRQYVIDDLVEACNHRLQELDSTTDGVSKRQIQKDIQFMESPDGWNIELVTNEKQGRKRVYRYADSAFSINNMPLNEMEMEQLQSAVSTLSQFKGLPQFEWMHDLLPRLQQNIRSGKEPQTIIEFDNNPYLRGIEYLGELYNAILYKKVLQVSYQPFENEKPDKLTFHPYYLKRFNNRWFLFGYNPETNHYAWNLALDRIKGFKEVKEKYHENTQINFSEYFEDIIGVTKPEDGELEEIVLHFFNKAGHYVESKPLHGSQKTRWIEDNVLEVRVELFPNFELEKLLLSFGEDLQIIKPVHLAQKLGDRL